MQNTFGQNNDLRARIGRRNRATALTAGVIAVAIAHSAPSFASGDVAHGETVYQDCMICHSLDKNELGPKHRNVFGRNAGTVPGYEYSAALKASTIVWNEATLDEWLTDPQAVVPGTKMIFSVDDARDRADVIAFLKEKATTQPNVTAGAR